MLPFTFCSFFETQFRPLSFKNEQLFSINGNRCFIIKMQMKYDTIIDKKTKQTLINVEKMWIVMKKKQKKIYLFKSEVPDKKKIQAMI